jgi:phage terminase large subunit GpA-like protein
MKSMAKEKRKRKPTLKTRKFESPYYIIEALNALKPPEELTVSEWAEKHRVLDNKSSARPGPWSNSTTPYLKGIMDELNNYETEEIVFVKPTQVGGTEAIFNMLGYVVDQDPSPAMIVYPTDELAKSISKNRIEPMVHNCPTLNEKYVERDSSNLELQFNDMYVSLVGSNSPSGLASKPIKYLFMDETDKYPGASKKEADPVSLAKERTKTFHNKKIVMASTPTLKTNHIWAAKESADIEKHFLMPCPHCGKKIEFKFSNLRFPDDKTMSYADRAEYAHYMCQECGCIITDQQKYLMLQQGEWEVVEHKTQFARKVVFWLNTLYSPFVRFADVAKEFLLSKKDPDKFQNFVNSWLAEPWEDSSLKTNADLVLQRQTEYKETVVPPWAKMLVGGVDVQETSMYVSVRAFGDHITSQNIYHQQVLSFYDIEQIMNYPYKKPNGEEMLVALCLIDSGYNTDATYDFCADNSDWALPVKGASNPMLSHYKISKINKLDSKSYGMQLIIVDGGKYKDMIAARMRKENGQGSWMVYNGCDREYAEQVTAEHKINVKSNNGKIKQEWTLKTSHADNHYLDAEVYCLAGADLLGVRTLHLQETPLEQQQKPVKNEPENPEEQWIQENESWI